jgi:arginine-tRNA-protein transferase
MQQQAVFLGNVVDESYPMQRLDPAAFDAMLASGWRLLGRRLVRHNFSTCRGQMCRTLPLRIRLDQFRPSKSQLQVLRRGQAHFELRHERIHITPEKEFMFWQHAERFRERQSTTLASFLSEASHELPVPGQEFELYAAGQLAACSFFHFGQNALSGTYCIFDPAFSRHSPGAYTMLLEILLAQRLGKQYYYHGYAYDVPSQFDYKLNFKGLEVFDWENSTWSAHPRQSLRQWESLVEKV